MEDYLGTYKNRPRTVVFYGRVSTEHEQQISALGNQMEWYANLAERNPNWTVVAQYIDEGITGTQMKKRPSFMQMMDHARQRQFDLIVTRELSRFARNTVDALKATRELKQYGVEVYFVNDGIWTMDGDGEVRLTIMASIAQDESRKTSERVKAGQKISRENGVLYGTGNVLGYDLDKVNKTYTINEEQADTVRRVYELYANGYGETAVANMLMAEGRKDGGGGCTWTASKVSRVLRKPVYKGYKAYNQSHVKDYLSHERILKDVAELESAKQEGLVVERAYKALRRSYDTKISQEKALLARLQERWQVPEMGDVFTWNELFPDEKVSREFLDAFVPRIISIDGERFIWELQLMQNHCTVQCEREGAGADAQIRVGKIVQEPPE